MTRRQIEKSIGWICAITAVNAVGGAIYGIRGAPDVPREWLEGSPFRDYRLPGLMLGIGVGGSSGVAAAAAWRGSDHVGREAILAGTILTGWIAGQVLIIGRRSFLQPLMGGVGIAMIGLGARLRRPLQ